MRSTASRSTVCRQRREANIVLGNAGVLRVLQVGDQVTGFSEGD